MNNSVNTENNTSAVFDLRARSEGPMITPVAHFRLDPNYAGAWVVAGDLDSDGQAELVSARNVNGDDVHFTSAVAVHRLDGTILWRWGDPKVGRSLLHHDVACQIHDWDADGKPEVILLAEADLIVLEGQTGHEKLRFHIPPQASDCLVFADLAGRGHAGEVLVKTRYGQIWAFDQDGRQLWTVTQPGGYKTAHQPLPIDIDGDRREEILAGYTLLNPDGSVRWTLSEAEVDISQGHLDCARSLCPEAPAGQDMLITLCAANALLRIGPDGQVRWRRAGMHYESIDIGRTIPGLDERQIIVDIDHSVDPQSSPVLVLTEAGELLGRYHTPYSRHHLLVDWEGRGYEAIMLGQVRTLCDGTGKIIAHLDAALDPAREAVLSTGQPVEYLCASGNIVGHGDGDIVIYTNPSSDLWVFHSPERSSFTQAPIGFGLNFTLY